jgi:hypothetical protein
MCNKEIPSPRIKIIYLDNKNREVEEQRALRKMTSYFDDDNNVIKCSVRIRFSLDQDW